MTNKDTGEVSLAVSICDDLGEPTDTVYMHPAAAMSAMTALMMRLVDATRSARKVAKLDAQRRRIVANSTVEALGVKDDCFYFCDSLGQVRTITKFNQPKIVGIFMHETPVLASHFPMFDRDAQSIPGRFNVSAAAQAMISACAECGVIADGTIDGPVF
ncbi:MAG: hypothetical protein AAFY65_01280 [Pseudomonadota bacterium]